MQEEEQVALPPPADDAELSLPAPPAADPERRRALKDLGVAAAICLAAITYWAWDRPVTLAAATSAPAPAVTNPLGSDMLNNRGATLYAAKNYADAEALFRQAIASDPNGALGYCNLGAVLTSEGKYDEAIVMLERAVALDPAMKLAQNNLAWATQERAKRQ